MLNYICVYCGSRTGENPDYKALARHVGETLAQTGRTLVYGGGQVGLMGILADAAIDAGVDVIGVIPDFLALKEVTHPRVQDMHIVDSIHTRKALMAEKAEAFIALPGGIGTMEELFEILTWAQLGFHHKPIGLLNVNGYYDHLAAFLGHSVDKGLLKPEHRNLLQISASADDLLGRFTDWKSPPLETWLETSHPL